MKNLISPYIVEVLGIIGKNLTKMEGTNISSKRKKYRALYKLEAGLEIPMFILSLLWLYLLIVDLIKRLSGVQNILFYIIWGIFILEYLLKLYLAADAWSYIKRNWIT
ncbi:MAG: hypothetical protein M3015_03820, partial [Bacteroidota bacterium]|nr:hypothetical protein [Bacteroidota bacterium]